MINKRILKNTLMLYLRQILLIFVSLYSLRVVLNVLGVDDFGIYSVIAGIVTMCSFLSNSMASATQRYFSYAIGKKEKVLLYETFSVNIVIYIIIALLAYLLLKFLGGWFIQHELKLPADRVDSALLLYRYVTVTFLFSIFSAPFMSIIIAHEDMNYIAFVSLFEAILKLAILPILYYFPHDKLELYGVLLLIITCFNMMIYFIICMLKYEECKIKNFKWNAVLFKSVLRFTGWTLFGQVTTVGRNQAITIMLNQFFNPAIVAARAISFSVSSQVSMFSNNFNTGLYPPIVKSYANGENDNLRSLIFQGSKLTFFLTWIFTLPLILEMDLILKIWLQAPPKEAVLFSQLALIEALIVSISLPLVTAARAPGKIKVYEIILGCMQIGIFVFSYVFIVNGFMATSVFYVAIFVNVLMFFVRLKIVSHLLNLDIYSYITLVCVPLFKVVLVSTLLSLFLYDIKPEGIFWSLFSIIIYMVITAICMYFLGIDESVKFKIKQFFKDKTKLIGFI